MQLTWRVKDIIPQKRLNQLLILEEERSEALHKISHRQQNVKRYFDQSATIKKWETPEKFFLLRFSLLFVHSFFHFILYILIFSTPFPKG
jgi:hypothetical protein